MSFTAKKILLCFGAVFLALVSTSVLDVTGASKDPSTIEDVREAVHAGVEFERKSKWVDAVVLYRDSLKRWPDSNELKYGLRRARFHMNIDRRYSDKSYQAQLLNLSEYEALELLDEVLFKVHGHYVNTLSSTYFIAHGTESVYLALNNEAFLEKNNIYTRSLPEVASTRRMLFDEFWNKPVASPEAARNLVLEIANRLQKRLGIKRVPVILEYVFGGCNAMDDYSGYLTPEKLSDLYNNIEGEFVGLGIEMKAEEGKGILLVNVLPESPAEEGGLLPGDHITHIDNIDCRNKPTDESASLLTGKQGSQVHIRWVSKNNPERNAYFNRREVKVKSIPIVKIIDSNNGIGYIRMAGFQRTTSAEFDAAMMTLKSQGMRSLIWDLRGNPGGLLTAAVEVLDRVIDNGVLVSTKGRTQDQNWKYTAHSPGTLNIPIILLVDGNSASASEIVAGAFRDHQRGKIVGRQSYGKWSVQSIFPVNHKCGLRLTTAKFYSPADHNYSKIGLAPDVLVKRDPKDYLHVTRKSIETDADVLKAIDLFRDNTQLTRNN